MLWALQLMKLERQIMNIESKPTISTSFEHKIRREWVYVECSGWHDSNGLYKSRLDGIFLDGVNVTGLLTDSDLDDVLAAIDSALETQGHEDAHNSGINWPFPTI